MGQDHKQASVSTASISGLSDQCMCVWATLPQVFHWPDANEKVLVLHSNLHRHSSTSTWLPQKEASWEATLNVMSYFFFALCALPIVDSQIEQTWPDFHLLVLHHPSTHPQTAAQTNTTETHWSSKDVAIPPSARLNYEVVLISFRYARLLIHLRPSATQSLPWASLNKFGHTRPHVLRSLIRGLYKINRTFPSGWSWTGVIYSWDESHLALLAVEMKRLGSFVLAKWANTRAWISEIKKVTLGMHLTGVEQRAINFWLNQIFLGEQSSGQQGPSQPCELEERCMRHIC